MKRIAVVTVGTMALGLAGLIGVNPLAAAERSPGGDSLTVFVGEVSVDQLAALAASGLDRQEIRTTPAPDGKVNVEVDQIGRYVESLLPSLGKEGSNG